MNRFLHHLSLFALFFLLTAQPVFAVTIPNFPNCPFPGGDQIANYDSGYHGVPGDNTSYTGADQVYQLNENQVVQCLCTEEGRGVQTWWWKQPSLTAEKESVVNKQGWVRIPNGALWGLDSTIWFAKNTYYSCKGDKGGMNGSSSDSAGGSDSSSSGSSESTAGGALGASLGGVLGASTLAGTGSYGKIVGYLALGFVALMIRNRLRRA